MVAIFRCPLCNKPGRIYRTSVISKQTSYAGKKANEHPKTTRYFLRCSDDLCVDIDKEPTRWRVLAEYTGRAINDQAVVDASD